MNKEYIIKIIRDVWFGREKLWKVFWLYHFLLGTFLGFILELVLLKEKTLFSIFFLAFYTVFSIWVLRGLYSCRFNLENKSFIPTLITFIVCLNSFFLVLGIGYSLKF
jgi:hypothetical protein